MRGPRWPALASFAAALLLPWLVALAAPPASGLAGKVVAVADGDTLTLLTPARRQVKVRLAEIDTPETGQPYGSRAKQILSDLAFSKEARVEVTDTDRYGRAVGRLHVGATDVNAEMVRRGAAWVYVQYNRDRSLLRVEAEARAARRGLWALPESERVPPWEWRRGGKRDRPPPRGIAAPAAVDAPAPPTLAAAASARDRGSPDRRSVTVGQTRSCGGKRVCRQMADCTEARFYLNRCGVNRLDGDSDGVPCEKLCG
jgi:endonuclease YncB( thermonuclease family)